MSDIGKEKTAALKNHLMNINSELKITAHSIRLTPENMIDLFHEADILIEAFDLAENKEWLIETWAACFPDKLVIGGNGLAGYGKFDTRRSSVRGTCIYVETGNQI